MIGTAEMGPVISTCRHCERLYKELPAGFWGGNGVRGQFGGYQADPRHPGFCSVICSMAGKLYLLCPCQSLGTITPSIHLYACLQNVFGDLMFSVDSVLYTKRPWYDGELNMVFVMTLTFEPCLQYL